MPRHIASFALVAALTLVPRAALACAMCLSGLGERALRSYFASAIMLSALPFALIGGIILAGYVMRNRRHGEPPAGAHGDPPSELMRNVM